MSLHGLLTAALLLAVLWLLFRHDTVAPAGPVTVTTTRTTESHDPEAQRLACHRRIVALRDRLEDASDVLTIPTAPGSLTTQLRRAIRPIAQHEVATFILRARDEIIRIVAPTVGADVTAQVARARGALRQWTSEVESALREARFLLGQRANLGDPVLQEAQRVLHAATSAPAPERLVATCTAEAERALGSPLTIEPRCLEERAISAGGLAYEATLSIASGEALSPCLALRTCLVQRLNQYAAALAPTHPRASS